MSEKKKSLWILNHAAVTPNMPGGTRHYDLSKELAKRGYEVTIFTSGFHYTQHKETKLNPGEIWKVEEIDGIKFIWIRAFPYYKNDWRRVFNMLSFMIRAYYLGRFAAKSKLHIKKPDFIIGSSVHLFTPLAAYHISKYHNAHFIFEVRDLWPKTLIDIGKISKYHPFIILLHYLEKYLYKRAEKIISLLPLAYKYFITRGINPKTITWIPNGIDLNKFSNPNRIESKSSQFKVIYLGAHGQANSLEILLEAAKIVQDKKYSTIQFVFIGDGAQKKSLINYKEKLKLTNTEFHNPLNKNSVPIILNEADALVSLMKGSELYKYGISSNKVYDYAASGKPIILSGNPVNNIVKETNCGISVSPDNPKALAKAIIELYHMAKEKREEMGTRGRKYVEENHAIPVLVDKLENVFIELRTSTKTAIKKHRIYIFK